MNLDKFRTANLKDIANNVKSGSGNGEPQTEEIKVFKKDLSDVYKQKEGDFKFMQANQGRLGPATVFPEIDKLTKGFRKGGLIGIGAFSNTGKSQLSYHYAQGFLKDGLDIAYFSLEVNASKVLTHITQYYDHIDFKEAAEQEDTGKYKGLLSIYDSNDYSTLEEIEAYVDTFKPDVIFIDFIQMLKVKGIFKEYEMLKECAGRLATLGLRNGTTIIFLSQVSNDDNKGTAKDSNFKGGGDLFARCDLAFFMKKTDHENVIEYFLKKNKDGPAYKPFNLAFDFTNGKCILKDYGSLATATEVLFNK